MKKETLIVKFKKNVTIRLYIKEIKILKEFSKKYKCTQSQIIESMINYFNDNNKNLVIRRE